VLRVNGLSPVVIALNSLPLQRVARRALRELYKALLRSLVCAHVLLRSLLLVVMFGAFSGIVWGSGAARPSAHQPAEAVARTTKKATTCNASSIAQEPNLYYKSGCKVARARIALDCALSFFYIFVADFHFGETCTILHQPAFRSLAAVYSDSYGAKVAVTNS